MNNNNNENNKNFDMLDLITVIGFLAQMQNMQGDEKQAQKNNAIIKDTMDKHEELVIQYLQDIIYLLKRRL